MIELSRQDMADLRGCHVSTVSKAGLPKKNNGKYDLQNPEVWTWVTAPAVAAALREDKRKARQGKDVDDLGNSDLDDELVRENIEWKRRQSRKLDLEYEKQKENLHPTELIAIWIGYFAAGIRTNFLNIGNRVARGDTVLRDRIEKEVKKSIEKTIAGAEAGLKEEAETLVKSLETE